MTTMTTSRRRLLSGALLLGGMLLTLPVAAPAQQTGAVRGASVEGITEYTLPNGLQVLLFPDESKPTTTVNITYYVGSRHESYGETGMAHLLEHLLFKGTPKHPDITKELTERGASPNGTTSFDRTNYYATFTASEDNLEWALGLEADRMVNSFIAQRDLDSEMTVVRNEFEAGENSPFGVLLKRSLATAFHWHNYGNMPIGARSDIEGVPIERLQAFYRKYYQPDNALLIVAGKFDEAHALRVIEREFGAIPRPDRSGASVLYETYTREPTQDGERSITLRRSGDLQMVMGTYRKPAGSHPDFAAVEVLAQVLGSAPSGRLYQALVEPKKAARVGTLPLQAREPGVLIAFAEVRLEDSLDEARDVFTRTIEAVGTEPPSAEEVERAKTALLRTIELTLNASDRIGLQLSEWASMGDWRLLFIHRDRLREVTPADVQRVAATYLKPSNRTLALFIPTAEPDRAIIPEAPPIAPLVASYVGDTTRVAGEAFDPTPEVIEARTTRSELPGGFRLILLPKQTRGAAVNAALTLRLGSEQALAGRAEAGSFAAAMLMRGTQQRSRQELRDAFDRLQSRVSLGGGATSASGSIETTRDNLPAVLRLLGEVLREPAFDERELEQLRQERLAALDAARAEPAFVAQIAFTRHMSPFPPGHARYIGTYEEQVAAIRAVTIEDVRSFYRDFYGAGAGELAVIGDFDADEVRGIATAIFSDWNAPQPFQRIATPFHQPEPVNLTLETPDKTNAMLVAGLAIEMTDEHPDYPALIIANYMIGQGVLHSRLATRIRQQEGLSYGVGSFLSAHPIDPAGNFTAQAIYAPENVAPLETALREEIERAVRDGFTAEELQVARQGYLQSRQVGRAQDAALSRQLANSTYFGRTMAWDAAFEARIAALTLDQVNAALQRHVDPARLTVIKAGDFAGSGGN